MRDIPADPFFEYPASMHRVNHAVLGGRFTFESNSRKLLKLVDQAFGGLPAHRFGSPMPRFRMRLRLIPQPRPPRHGEPPAMQLVSGSDWLGAVAAGSGCVMISPATRAGLLVIPETMLDHAYHLRYEWIELATLTLAARAQTLIPLHAGCVGWRGRGVLLLGASGAGKSTACLHWLLRGHEFLAEDSVFVAPETLCATAVPSFLHLREPALGCVAPKMAASFRAAPKVRRRSGIVKFEVDLRRMGGSLAPRPLPLSCVALLSPRRARGAPLARRLTITELRSHLLEAQPYAAVQPGWREFIARLAKLPLLELRRGAHPDDTVAALESQLAGAS
ncbi:MAG: serine kinase [Pseudomonadota bacterium]